MIQSKPSQEKAIVAYIAPIGSKLTMVNETLKNIFESFNVDVHCWGLSKKFKAWLEILKTTGKDKNSQKRILKTLSSNLEDNSYEIMDAKIEAGDLICASEKDSAALIKRSIKDIKYKLKNGGPKVLLFRQLKRVEELAELRNQFGDGLFTLGLYSPEENRKKHLMMGMTEGDAEDLIRRDEGKEVTFKKNEYGQEVEEIFSHADAFIDVSNGNFQFDLKRIAELLLGNPFIAPNPEEHAMFLAFVSSLRSLDLSRQVGAVITSQEFDVLGTGFNEVPAAGGGHYSNKSNLDGRDWAYFGYDTNRGALIDIVDEIKGEGKKRAANWLKEHKNSKLNSTLDFGRPVHAEMSAVSACARNGISTKNAYMFVTTFPCHNCAKHLIAAGIKRIYFIEPYPKSLTCHLHDDAIFLNDSLMNDDFHKVELRPYVGVGPRRFFDLFALNSGNGINLKRKNSSTGECFRWPNDMSQIRSDNVLGGFPRVRILPK